MMSIPCSKSMHAIRHNMATMSCLSQLLTITYKTCVLYSFSLQRNIFVYSTFCGRMFFVKKALTTVYHLKLILLLLLALLSLRTLITRKWAGRGGGVESSLGHVMHKEAMVTAYERIS